MLSGLDYLIVFVVISWELFYILAAMEKGLCRQFFCCRETDSNNGVRKRRKAAARLINKVAAEAQEGKMDEHETPKTNEYWTIVCMRLVLLLVSLFYIVGGVIPTGEFVTGQWVTDNDAKLRGRVQVIAWSEWFSFNENRYTLITVHQPPFGITTPPKRAIQEESLAIVPRGAWSLIFSGQEWFPRKGERFYDVKRIGGNSGREISDAPPQIAALFHEGRQLAERSTR